MCIRDSVHFASKIYGAMEDQLSDDIVLIGGGEIGVETALYLCELGKRVTVLEMLPELIADAPHAHYKNMVHNYWRKQPNFHFQCGVTVTSVSYTHLFRPRLSRCLCACKRSWG